MSYPLRLASFHFLPPRWVPLLTSLVSLVCLPGCSKSDHAPAAPPELRVLCGSSMADPMQEVARRFEQRRGVKVMLDLGGSETLLPRILAGAAADIFVCHDPFEQKAKDAGKWSGSTRVGVLQPVLLVKRGNPRHIHSLNDLTNASLKVGIGDPRYSTCGELFVQRLDRKGIREGVMKQVVLQGRSHTEIANGLIVGPLDAVSVWNFVARLYAEKAELVPTDDAYPAINVTIVGLAPGPNPTMRDAFLDFCRTKEVKTLFAQHGYGPVQPVLNPQ